MALIRWHKPETAAWPGFDEIEDLRRQMDQLLETPFAQWSSPRFFREWAPLLDVYQDAENVYVKLEVPGLKKEDIDVSLHNGALTITGERKREEREGQTRSERFYGRFSRTVTLPVAVEGGKVSANYTNGVLSITLPKAEEAKPKQIEINVK